MRNSQIELESILGRRVAKRSKYAIDSVQFSTSPVTSFLALAGPLNRNRPIQRTSAPLLGQTVDEREQKYGAHQTQQKTPSTTR